MCEPLLHYYYRQCSGDISACDPAHLDQQKSAEWAEYASELWVDDKLGHIRKAAIPYDYGMDFVYDPKKGMFAFQKGMEEQEEDEDQELSFTDAQPNEPEIIATPAVGESPQPQPEPQELLQPSASLLILVPVCTGVHYSTSQLSYGLIVVYGNGSHSPLEAVISK